VKRAPAPAKINLALVVGPIRDDGKHELVTVFQRIDVADRIELHEAAGLRVEGFADDTLVRGALETLPDEQRQTIELAYFGGFTHVQIAELLEEPVGTVKGRMRLGLEKMRRQLVEGAA